MKLVSYSPTMIESTIGFDVVRDLTSQVLCLLISLEERLDPGCGGNWLPEYAFEIEDFYDLDIPIFDALCGMCDVATWIKSMDKYFEYAYLDLAKQAKHVEYDCLYFNVMQNQPPKNCLKGYNAELTRDEAVVSLKVDSEKIEEPMAQTNQGIKVYSKDHQFLKFKLDKLDMVEHVSNVEHKIEVFEHEETVEHLAFTGKDLFCLFHIHVVDDFDVDKHNSMLFVKMCNYEVPMDVRSRTFYACGNEFCHGMKKLIFRSMILSIWKTILLRQYQRKGVKRIYSLGVYQNHRKRGSYLIWNLN
ncbi:hypothetical protein FNV43_RR16829 [Rhamnella rubrinervis]|uniref:Uncharacterized protein n=1 Tax=Rhamnella rubrinervis TaxID=2594499 RepID=A0A8K0MDW3_9ROSA|nr:hypothetical protein FNV43_RR16829 [Rhamnella rubrinervis]